MNSLALHGDDEWPLELLIRNLDTLKVLSIGLETTIANEYARGGAWSRTSSAIFTQELGVVLANRL